MPTELDARTHRMSQLDHEGHDEQEEETLKVISGGTSLEAFTGVGVVVLAILGLAHVLPIYLTAIATIVAGAGLLFGGAGGAARMNYFRSHAASNEKFAELSGGLSAEFLGGVAGVVLGILGLLGIVPTVLLPVAMIVFGGALLIGAGATSRINQSPGFGADYSQAEEVSRNAASAASGAQVLVGLASIALGILGLVGIDWLTLTLVALLCVGASTFLSGATLTTRLQTILHQL